MSDLLNEVRISRGRELISSIVNMDDLKARNLMFYAMLKNKNDQMLSDGLVSPTLSEFIHAIENLIVYENLYNLAKKDIENILKKFKFEDDLHLNLLWASKEFIKDFKKPEEGEEDGLQEE